MQDNTDERASQGSTESQRQGGRRMTKKIVTARSVEAGGQELSISLEIPTTKNGDPMFAKLYLWLLSSGNLSQMSGSSCKVYLALLCRADFDTLECWPSTQTIASDAGVSKRSVNFALNELVKLRVITRYSGKQSVGNIVNRYIITQPPDPSANSTQGLCNKCATPSTYFAHKQETRTKAIKQDRGLPEKSSADLSADAHRIRRRLIEGGVSLAMVKELTNEYPLESIESACLNADALQSTGAIKSWPGYVVAAVFGAANEGKVVSPTNHSKQIVREREQIMEQQQAEDELIKREQRARRQGESFKMFGTMNRWQEIPLIK